MMVGKELLKLGKIGILLFVYLSLFLSEITADTLDHN